VRITYRGGMYRLDGKFISDKQAIKLMKTKAKELTDKLPKALENI